MAVAIHVRIRVCGNLADEIERILPAKIVDDGRENENAQQDSVAHKLVRDDRLHEESQKNKRENLREGYQVELLEVLSELVMVVARDGLHHHADEHRESEEDDLDYHHGREAG